MTYCPKFNFTLELTNFLIDIETSRQAISDLPVTVEILTSLRESARLSTTHYSTQIEGNRLTRNQVEEVVHGGTFPNRERDERQVKNYYIALDGPVAKNLLFSVMMCQPFFGHILSCILSFLIRHG